MGDDLDGGQPLITTFGHARHAVSYTPLVAQGPLVTSGILRTCSQSLVNLMLHGHAVAHVWDGDQDLGGGMLLKGVVNRRHTIATEHQWFAHHGNHAL